MFMMLVSFFLFLVMVFYFHFNYLILLISMEVFLLFIFFFFGSSVSKLMVGMVFFLLMGCFLVLEAIVGLNLVLVWYRFFGKSYFGLW